MRLEAVGLLAASALVGACGGAQKVRLEPEKASRIELDLGGGGTAFCAHGGAPRLRAVVTYQEGKQVVAGYGGRLPARQLEWRADLGRIGDSAQLILPDNPLVWMDRTITVRARVPGKPQIADELMIAPRFDCRGIANFSGPPGRPGGAGQNGERGGRGPALDVALAYVDSQRNGRLILVRVTPRMGGHHYYLVDAGSPPGTFAVSAAGGRGGDGGRGVAGQAGAPGQDGVDGKDGGTCEDGGDGTAGTDGQDGGNGGPGGDGGDGGDGGRIVVAYPKEHPELGEKIGFIVAGGAPGGPGPGGFGGQGGDGGDGGDGGFGGSTSDANGEYCSTSRGQDGQDGRDGRDGFAGPSGKAGHAGRSGELAGQQADVRELFASEIERGAPIILDAP